MLTQVDPFCHDLHTSRPSQRHKISSKTNSAQNIAHEASKDIVLSISIKKNHQTIIIQCLVKKIIYGKVRIYAFCQIFAVLMSPNLIYAIHR